MATRDEDWVRALALLSEGEYAAAWPLYETRRHAGFWQPYPAELEWRGEPVGRLAVIGEQGFGDCIMFARFVDAIQGRAERVTYIVPDEVVPLFRNAQATRAATHRWVFVGSLPGLLGVTLDNLPPPAQLTVEASTGSGIGVCADGRPTHPNNGHRSLCGPDRDRLLSLGRDLSPAATGARDFRDTAEIIAGLELVITVDTAVAHLAATMGKPTWILLPATETDWRWLRGRTDSPWYPSARLFRQPAPGQWGRVLDDVTSALQVEA